MLYYDGIYITEGIDLPKSNKSKECMIFHYFFFIREFKFQDSLCHDCDDLAMFCLNISNITIITGKNFDYRCIIHNISKSEAINLLDSAMLRNREHIVLNFTLFKTMLLLLFSIYKMADILSIYKSLNISIRTVMKNLEMLKLVSDYLKTKKMCKHTVKKLPYLLRYVPDQYKTPQCVIKLF